MSEVVLAQIGKFPFTDRVAECVDESRGADAEIEDVERRRREEIAPMEDVIEHDGAHALEDVRRRARSS